MKLTNYNSSFNTGYQIRVLASEVNTRRSGFCFRFKTFKKQSTSAHLTSMFCCQVAQKILNFCRINGAITYNKNTTFLKKRNYIFSVFISADKPSNLIEQSMSCDLLPQKYNVLGNIELSKNRNQLSWPMLIK